MALNVCKGCTTKFAVGLPKCPHCGSTEYEEDGIVPKISRHGGPSDKTLPRPDAVPEGTAWVSEPGPMLVSLPTDGAFIPAAPAAAKLNDAEEDEESSLGSSSSASTPRPPTSSEPSKPDHPKRARMTGNRSGKGRTESSSASSTVFDGQTEQ